MTEADRAQMSLGEIAAIRMGFCGPERLAEYVASLDEFSKGLWDLEQMKKRMKTIDKSEG